MNSSVQVGFVLNSFASLSVWRLDPSHNLVQYPDLSDVSQHCAWSKSGKMLDDEMLGQLFLEHLQFSCPTPQNRRRV